MRSHLSFREANPKSCCQVSFKPFFFWGGGFSHPPLNKTPTFNPSNPLEGFSDDTVGQENDSIPSKLPSFVTISWHSRWSGSQKKEKNQGSLSYSFFLLAFFGGGSKKSSKSMVILEEFPIHNALYGLVILMTPEKHTLRDQHATGWLENGGPGLKIRISHHKLATNIYVCPETKRLVHLKITI